METVVNLNDWVKLVVLLRSGLEIDGRQLAQGHHITVPRIQAEALMRNGAAERVQT
ncbi:MAG: hypothetical protein WDN04_18205 [Rhodospirillales bacterium]